MNFYFQKNNTVPLFNMANVKTSIKIYTFPTWKYNLFRFQSLVISNDLSYPPNHKNLSLNMTQMYVLIMKKAQYCFLGISWFQSKGHKCPHVLIHTDWWLHYLLLLSIKNKRLVYFSHILACMKLQTSRSYF